MLVEGEITRVRGQGRRVYRVVAILGTRGEFNAVDDNGRMRTFRSDDAMPAKPGDVAPKRSGEAAPASHKAGRR